MLNRFLLDVFGGEDKFWALARRVQDLAAVSAKADELVARVADLIREDPRYFLVFMHLHRQLRFTSSELIKLLFDPDQLDSLAYYDKLMSEDPRFGDQYRSAIRSKAWTSYTGIQPEIKPLDEIQKLACMKRTIDSYLDDEASCWELWKSRITTDPASAKRIAEFLLFEEDLLLLIKESVILSALKRSMRTTNVESVKAERGSYGETRVRQILLASGFVHESMNGARDLEEVEERLGSGLIPADPSRWSFVEQKRWRGGDKKFDFLLAKGSKVVYAVETNYFTTSMSKIKEVVIHFKELYDDCDKRNLRLIYITDGAGWLRLPSYIKSIYEYELEHGGDATGLPFLMTLKQFERAIPNIRMV